MLTTRSLARGAAASLAFWWALPAAATAQEPPARPHSPAELPPLPPGDPPALRRAPAGAPVPDAGDDQIGLVGRQITLNGGRSEPKGALAYRWIQMSGPERALKAQDGYILTFTPLLPGVYRFALVVAANSEISEPDVVEVTVGTLNQPPAAGNPFGGESPARPPSMAAPPAIGDMARAALAGIEGGPDAAPALASTFEAVAGRMSLYRTYNDAFGEMSRRLDAFVPADPARRAAWVDRLFQPLTVRLVEQMRGAGLDLAQPSAAASPLTDPQKERLADQFRAIAQGLRPAGTIR